MSLYQTACSVCRHARKVLLFTSCIIVVALSVFGGYTFYSWLSDGDTDVTLLETTLSSSQAAPADTVMVYQRLKKVRDCGVRIKRILSGDCGYYVLHDSIHAIESGFDGRIGFAERIPFDAIPGACTFRVQAQSFCNPLDALLGRKIVESAAIPFTITPHQL